jgi:hypothetical protein
MFWQKDCRDAGELRVRRAQGALAVQCLRERGKTDRDREPSADDSEELQRHEDGGVDG